MTRSFSRANYEKFRRGELYHWSCRGDCLQIIYWSMQIKNYFLTLTKTTHLLFILLTYQHVSWIWKCLFVLRGFPYFCSQWCFILAVATTVAFRFLYFLSEQFPVQSVNFTTTTFIFHQNQSGIEVFRYCWWFLKISCCLTKTFCFYSTLCRIQPWLEKAMHVSRACSRLKDFSNVLFFLVIVYQPANGAHCVCV